MTVLSAILFALHTCRKPDARHLKNLIIKLKTEDLEAYKGFMSKYKKMYPRDVKKIEKGFMTKSQ